ncbi:MAG: alkaline phosphatase family protein [Acidobacteriota bacterium]
MPPTKAYLATIPALLVAIALAARAAAPTRAARFRVVVLGIDGATWRAIDPLIGRGLLPAFAALRASAATGDLLSMPPYNSPQMWTTIATGQPPAVHGIENFVMPGPGGKPIPASSNLRRCPAIWSIASEHGRRIGVVGWYVTWPAEPVNGFVISDHVRPMEEGPMFWPVTAEQEKTLGHRTYPDALLATVASCCFVDPAGVDRPEMREDLPIFGAKHPYLQDETAMRAALYLARRLPYDVLLCYQHGTDVMQHIGYGPFDAYLSGDEIQERKARRVIAYYRYEDDNVRRLVQSLGGSVRGGPVPRIDLPRDAVLVVVSDHGFGPGRRPLQPALTGDHRPEGILALCGGPFARGIRIHGASVLDVLPTTLALLGIPISRELPGSDLSGLPHLTTDRPYARGAQGGEPVPSPLDGAIMDELRALGYIR